MNGKAIYFTCVFMLASSLAFASDECQKCHENVALEKLPKVVSDGEAFPFPMAAFKRSEIGRAHV